MRASFWEQSGSQSSADASNSTPQSPGYSRQRGPAVRGSRPRAPREAAHALPGRPHSPPPTAAHPLHVELAELAQPPLPLLRRRRRAGPCLVLRARGALEQSALSRGRRGKRDRAGPGPPAAASPHREPRSSPAPPPPPPPPPSAPPTLPLPLLPTHFRPGPCRGLGRPLAGRGRGRGRGRGGGRRGSGSAAGSRGGERGGDAAKKPKISPRRETGGRSRVLAPHGCSLSGRLRSARRGVARGEQRGEVWPRRLSQGSETSRGASGAAGVVRLMISL